MNEETTSILVFIAILTTVLALPFLIIGAILSCTAYSRTREWQKEKQKAAAKADADVEMDRLVSEDDHEEEEEPLDSEDEAEIAARKEASKPDWDLTFFQKWKKEFKWSWKCEALKEAVAKKEREERAKIARQVAREMLRVERRRKRKLMTKLAPGGKAQEAREEAEYGLPTYDTATASSTSDEVRALNGDNVLQDLGISGAFHD